MAIISASIEPEGWILRLVMQDVPAGNFSDYEMGLVIAPFVGTDVPRVVLQCTDAGFVQSNGQAVAGSHVRTIVGTRVMRLPRPDDQGSNPPLVIDETALPNNQRAVRIALSEMVYAGSTNLSLSVLAGWRTGEGAASGISVTNNSTRQVPVPIRRWVTPQFEVTGSTVRVSVLAATMHPMNWQPCAGVRFTVTDTSGQVRREAWVTALAFDTAYNDSIRCYTHEFDLSAGSPALGTGLLRIDAEVYPWIGAMRSTDPSATRAMAGLRDQAMNNGSDVPLVVGFDPAGARYGQWFAFCDPVNGTATAAATMIQPTLAAAKALAPADRPRNASTAIQAMRLVNRAMAAANEQPAVSERVVDGLVIVLPAGTTDTNGTTVSSPANNTEIPVRIIGDPDDPNPRQNCIISAAGSAWQSRCRVLSLRNCVVALGGSSFISSAPTAMMTNNCIVRGRPSFETVSNGLFSSTTANTWHLSLVNTRWWRTGTTLAQTNTRVSLMRSVEHSRTASGQCIVGCRWISEAEDTTFGPTVLDSYTVPTMSGEVPGLRDIIIAHNHVRNLRGRFAIPPSWTITPAPVTGAPNTRIENYVLLNNLVEKIGSDQARLFILGSGQWIEMANIVVEGNTWVGQAYNGPYNDPPVVTLADTYERFSTMDGYRHCANALHRNASKHDQTSDSQTVAIREAAYSVGDPRRNGFRSQLTQVWETHFGVNFAGNFDASLFGATDTQDREFPGLRSFQSPFPPNNTLPGHVDDQSALGAGGGNGDYRPAAGSPLLGRVTNANTDVYRTGQLRTNGGASGSEVPAAGVLMIGPAGGVHGHVAAMPALEVDIRLVPQSATHGLASGTPALLTSVALAPAAALHPTLSGPAVLALAGTLGGRRRRVVGARRRTLRVGAG